MPCTTVCAARRIPQPRCLGHFEEFHARALHSLAITDAHSEDRRPGFILVSARDATKRDRGNSDELQDLTCTIADHPTH
ncbi:MAG: CDP-diacylglycerol diphosphatase [Rudaea sp.]|uniref:CDP-diacylglycerol diphosphatase n=1 Tax=Rudaea sp. 3F27F6 TaxID=2502208 RepID=UPI0010F9788C|nr:CDP-diacylglycerol diphosphatase [Rudaea sp. 3F27F6]MBN8884982.1 CDP-diacylglycerol diphosphatase [Rudaea sp.]